MYRIRKVEGGFVSEQKVRYLFFWYKWVPFIPAYGLPSAWIYQTYDYAFEDTMMKLRSQLYANSKVMGGQAG